MKLAVTQSVLGIIIILGSLWVTGWMIYQAPHLLRQRDLREQDKVSYIDVVPDHNALFNVSRYGSYALPVLGILLVISGTVRASVKNNKRFWPVLNIVIGVLAAALALVIARWGYPTSFSQVQSGTIPPEGTQTFLQIFSNPGPELVHSQEIAAALVLPGLAALGVGIAQLVKSKKTALQEVA